MNITIVGLGVIGGSFAMAFKEAGFEDVYSVDLNKESIEKAKNMGIIKDGSDNAKQFLEIADLVIICIYPRISTSSREACRISAMARSTTPPASLTVRARASPNTTRPIPSRRCNRKFQ